MDDDSPIKTLSFRMPGSSFHEAPLQWMVRAKAGLSLKTKLSIFKSIFIPILTYGHELWIITEKLRTRVRAAEMGFLRRVADLMRGPELQAVEMGFLRRVAGLTRLDMVRNISGRTLEYSLCFSRLRSHSCDGLGFC
ncbi:unnamed protein product [Soboliphyme baturini]|uniref:Uncharacterized protein n=1 Tax=Soboliphyme baturini TaxID=241478 RepID=A0A183J927_9BILA|nr:unnamed protein product [Soboliphyme baturini]